MNLARVVVADHHALFRTGLRAMLDDIELVEVASEAADGSEALDRVSRLAPDLVMADIDLPRLTGIELARAVSRDHPNTAVIVLNLEAEPECICRSFQAGASGYLVKDTSRPELELAVRTVLGGQKFVSPAAVSRLVEDVLIPRVSPVPGPGGLPPRQQEVLHLASRGLSTKQIARQLGISTKTVETHRSMLMMRLGVHNLAGLVQQAIRLGLIEPGRIAAGRHSNQIG